MFHTTTWYHEQLCGIFISIVFFYFHYTYSLTVVLEMLFSYIFDAYGNSYSDYLSHSNYKNTAFHLWSNTNFDYNIFLFSEIKIQKNTRYTINGKTK